MRAKAWHLVIGNSRHSLGIPVPIAAAAMLCCFGAAHGASINRWVDDQGNTHYGDKIPPSQVEKGHTELSPDGIRVRTIPPAKTLEEIRRERELERLRAQRQRLIEQQKAADQVLLRTFRSEDDLIMARDGKLTAIDTMIQISKVNISRQQVWLNDLRTAAADLERAGEEVGSDLKARIAATERSLNKALGTIVEHEQKKQVIRGESARNLKRFRQLKNIPETASDPELFEETPALENLVNCDGKSRCDSLWRRAVAYVKSHATVPLQTVGTDVVMTDSPTTSRDIALSVSRIWNQEHDAAAIFLDLQCRNYTQGGRNCNTEARLKIRNGFRAAIEANSTRTVND